MAQEALLIGSGCSAEAFLASMLRGDWGRSKYYVVDVIGGISFIVFKPEDEPMTLGIAFTIDEAVAKSP